MKKDIGWYYLAHFGYNMWVEPLVDKLGVQGHDVRSFWSPYTNASDKLLFQEDYWKELTTQLQQAGCTHIVLDVGDGVIFDSHPELAVEGSWTKQRFADELARLRGMGFEVLPKLNFSGTFDGNGCAIIGLYSKTPSAEVNAGGLFYNLNGTVKNLSILDAQIHVTSANAKYAGVFAGEAANATIINCYTNAKVTAERTNVAGFVGHMNGPLTIRNSHFDGVVNSTSSYIGGFVGNHKMHTKTGAPDCGWGTDEGRIAPMDFTF